MKGNDWKERKLGALWKRDGNLITGEIEIGEEKIDVVVFENDDKLHDRSPDFVIYKSKPKEKRVKEEKPRPVSRKTSQKRTSRKLPKMFR